MAPFGRDYDRDFGFGDRPGRWGSEPGFRGHSGRSFDADPYPNARYGGDPNSRYGGDPGWSGRYRYGSDFERHDYDRGYKSRFQTDHGDPFGDRQRNTPMRTYREDPPSGRWGRSQGYDRNFDYDAPTPFPFGYRTFRERNGYDEGFRSRPYRGYAPRDNGWW